MEVIYEGWLEKGLQLGSKKEWKKRYFVLKKASGSNCQTIEYYKDKDWRKQDPKGVFNLLAGYHVNPIDDLQRKKFLFEVKTLDSSILLAANSEATRQKWSDVLNNSLTVKSFTAVLINSPESAAKFTENIKGPVILQITDSAVVLSSVHTCNISWQFGCIRRYKCHHGIFILEVGRKSMTGEGTFEFNTNDPQELFRVLDTALKDRIKSKGLQGAGTTDKSVFDSSDHKPPPLPNHPPELKRMSSLIDRSNLPLPSPAPYDMKRTSSLEKVQPPPLPLDRKRPSAPEPRSPPHEYSSLGLSKSPEAAAFHSADGYDHLSGAASRLVAKRGSDSGILNGEKRVLHATRSVKAVSSPASFLPEETYMDMAGTKDVTKASPLQPAKKQPPTPPTRVAKPALHSAPATHDVTYDSIRDSEIMDESYYNTPSAFTWDSARSEDHSLEYDELDHSDQRPILPSSATEYNHLNEAVAFPNATPESELYDTPSGNNGVLSSSAGVLKAPAQKASPPVPRFKPKMGEAQPPLPRQIGLLSRRDSHSGDDVKMLSSESGGSQSSLEQQDYYDTPGGSLSTDTYDVPASAPLASVKKESPAKPIRRPPTVPDPRSKPSVAPAKKNDADLVSKLKRNLELSGFKPPIPGAARPIPGQGPSAHDIRKRLSDPGVDATSDDEEQAYDCPASLPADGYNRVGEIISGQYGRGFNDDHGYVQVPDSQDDGLYQDVRSDV